MRILRACAALACALPLLADVRLPAVFADHMVIQRDRPVHVWGFAAPAEAVAATFRGETRNATADELGRWGVYFPPVAAGGPFELRVNGTNAIAISDILAGDVWIASGQSNMEFTLDHADNAKAEIAEANFPRIRLFHVQNKSSEFPLDDVEAEPWTPCTPESAAKFSAVAYFFARDLQKADNAVPLGLISSNWGGSPADAWISLSGLSADAGLMPAFADWARMMNDNAAENIRRAQDRAKWQKAVAEAEAAGKTRPGLPWRNNPGMSWRPAGLWNAMIAPLVPFPIKGVIWYQGESNASAERAPLYAHLFQSMIRDWRRAWGEGDFPFLFVQLANWKAGPNSLWPVVRDAQRQTLELKNTGMAVAIDIGNPTDIHPTNKRDVGHRLALWARALEGDKIEYSGPLFRQTVPENGGMRVWFDHARGMTARGGDLHGFEIAGADRKWQPATARIDGDTVVVSAAAVASPRYVRYGWSDNPDVNLYNAAGLPASPFTSAQ